MGANRHFSRVASVLRMRTDADDAVIGPAWIKIITYLGRAEVLPEGSLSPLSAHIRLLADADAGRK